MPVRLLSGALLSLLALTQHASAEQGLLNHWVFDPQHTSGAVVKDLAGKLPATIVGPVSFVRQGQVDVLLLDGTSNSVAVLDDYTKATVPKRDITAEAWVRVDKTQEWGGLVGIFQDNGPYERGWVLGFKNNRFCFGLNSGAGEPTTTYLEAADTFHRGVWHHVVGTYDGKTQRIYVNGREAASSTAESGDISYPPAAFYHIGAYRDNDEFFRTAGRLREVRVYDRALSADEIKRHYDEQAGSLPRPAALKLPNIFGSRMVLQRDRPIPVWGRAQPGDKLIVTLADATVEATNEAGNWKATLPAQQAGGPHTLTIRGIRDEVTFDNVMVGEVWLCSGQSNMQMNVNSSTNGIQEAAAANHPNIRLFTVPNVMTPVPQGDCDGGWDVCSPQTVGTFSAVGYFFGRELQKELGVPIGLINASWGGSPCEAWMSHEALAADPDYALILERVKQEGLGHGTGMFNSMIHPLIPYGIRGAIWYQGESNCLRSVQYRKLFPALIAEWRQRWGQGDFPFYYVQLSPYGRHVTEWPEMWEAQLLTLKVPNTGMAVITDIGEPRNIHPLNKQGVGHRLALWALAKTYGRKEIVYSGPLYNGMKIEGDKIRLSFDHAQGLKTRDGKPLDWFTIAGEDKQFKPATATIDGQTVVVHSADVKEPVAVRFAWSDIPQPNFVNGAGLPASPFRTDDWQAVTAGAR